jgi:hypothetical protein
MIWNHRFVPGAPSLLAGLICFLFSAAPLVAQADSAVGGGGDALDGRVLLADTPVAGVSVELHRVTPATSGVIDRTTSDVEGRFRFSLPPVDTVGFTVFFATAEHGGVRYFGRPLHQRDDPGDYRVAVFDTTSAPETAPRLSRRDLVLLPQQDGSWEVNEIVRIFNAGTQTVVSASGMPTAEVDLPTGATAFEAGDGDSPAEQIQRMGDRVLILLPLLPGERELFFRYRLAARPARAEIAMRSPADTMNVFVRQPAPRLTIEGLAPSEVIQVEGERFLQFAAPQGGTSGNVEIRWQSGGPPVSPVTAAVVLTVVVLLVGGGFALRNRAA